MATSLSPAEAGKRAQELAAARKNDASSTSMSTLLSHAGLVVEDRPSPNNTAMAPPLHLSTTYQRDASGSYNAGDSIYARMDNPTRLLLEQEVAKLETHGLSSSTTSTCCAFASGMMAVSSILLSLQAPMHVFLSLDAYHGVPTLLSTVLNRFQVTSERIDMTNESSVVEKALAAARSKDATTTLVLWIETPSNPLSQVLDIAALCKVAKQYSATTVVDSTMAPPTIQQTLAFGADFSLHSATKCLAGHSDALLGVVTTICPELGTRLKQAQIAVGGVASPFDSWLCLRGMRTLAIRTERQCATAMQVAKYLDKHELVAIVHYPGLETHAQHEIAKKQMKLFGSVMSIELKTEAEAMALAGALTLVQRATSLGGTGMYDDRQKRVLYALNL